MPRADPRPLRPAFLAGLALIGICIIPAGATAAETAIRVFGAGSLKPVFSELGTQYRAKSGNEVEFEFGPSGLLRDRLVKGEPADVFASANMEHPRALSNKGLAAQPVRFARNRLCALTAPTVNVTSESLLDRMLDPAIKLGTSTPKADPSGDYAWELFGKAESLNPGAIERLSSKALKLTGGPDSPPPPKDRSVYGMLVNEGKADIFLTYCTNALAAQKETPSLKIVPVPPALAVGADYGITTLNSGDARSPQFVEFVLSSQGQVILKQFGFAPGTDP